MNQDTKTHLLGMFLAVMDGRDPRPHVLLLDGDDCLAGHVIAMKCDQLLKAQWLLMGAPMPIPEPEPEPAQQDDAA